MDAAFSPATPPVCPVCHHPGVAPAPTAVPDALDFSCPRCGEFTLPTALAARLAELPPDGRWKLSAVLRNDAPQGLQWADIEHITTIQRPPSLEQRALRVLRHLHQSLGPGRLFQPTPPDAADPNEPADPAWLARSWCRDGLEFQFLLRDVLVKALGWLEEVELQHGWPAAYRLTAQGVMRLESGAASESARTGFCAMWFDPSLEALWQAVIAPAIQAAGYEPVRLDKKDYNHSIDDEIVAEIRSCRFVVADLTGHRGGVYYEAGLAHGLGLPVVFMHRNDPLPDIHFDLRQYNILFWDPGAPDAARHKLTTRILATLGRGPLRP